MIRLRFAKNTGVIPGFIELRSANRCCTSEISLIVSRVSGQGQRQGISALIRAHQTTGKDEYLDTEINAFKAFESEVNQGGVVYTDPEGNPWIEEYFVATPTHILNGFIWGLWGVLDLYLATNDERAKSLWKKCVTTLTITLETFDLGWWSLYDQSGTPRLPMIASRFYQNLHIVQLEIMFQLINQQLFVYVAYRWEMYTGNSIYRSRAFAQKALFKLLKY